MVKEPNTFYYRKPVVLHKLSLLKVFLRTLTGAIWLINGLFCKVLNLVPRHQQIVARILGNHHAGFITKVIGCCEILIAVWVFSGIKPRWCTLLQIALVAVMNIVEFIVAPDLLLFGRMNIVVAAVFIAILFLNELLINKKIQNNYSILQH